MIDFNQASENQSAGVGVIPPNSCVLVRLSAVRPNAGMTGSDPLLTRCKSSSLEQFRTELTVAEGSYKGKVIYHNFNLGGAVNSGQKRAVQISMAQLRAAVEFARGIDPDDASPQAAEKRRVELSDLDGMVFPIIVDCQPGSQPSKRDPTRYYVNNGLYRVLTRKDPECEELRTKREIISSDPVPVFPTGASAANAAPDWARPSAQTPPPAQAPTWAASPTPPPAQPVQTPEWAADTTQKTDQVPF